MRETMTRAVLLAGVAVLIGGAAAYATGVLEVVGPDGTIEACYKTENGQLRVLVGNDSCRQSERPISWSEGVRGFRVGRSTPNEVAVTAVGTGPIGIDFPEGTGPTQILTMTLPQGVYEVNSTVAARKDAGNGDFICWVRDNTSAANFTRTALGADAGHSRRDSVASNGFFGIPAGGGTLTLECWQASNGAGPPAGEFPTVFYAALSATSVTRATLTRFPTGAVRELP